MLQKLRKIFLQGKAVIRPIAFRPTPVGGGSVRPVVGVVLVSVVVNTIVSGSA